jgi:class 3 adenylate cyclase
LDSAGRTLVCSVLFLDIADYSQRSVAEQLQLKQAFNQALAAALEQVVSRDRIILDTGDGAAVTFMGDPEDALFASLTMRDLSAKVPVRLGVNLGPVRLVKDLNGQMNIIGDGINVAQRVMSFARPGQLLVSRSFYEVVSCLSRDYASLFRHEGSRTDKHVRAHEVYAVVGAAPKPRMSEAETAGGLAPAASGPLGLRRSALAVAPLVFLLVVAGGVGARALLPAGEAEVKPAATKSEPVKPVVVAPAAGGAAAIETPRTPVARSEKKLEQARAEKPAAPQGPGRLELAVAPWGEVLVDGKSRGLSPPLRVLEVPAGTHTIEIRNSTFPAHVARVEVKAGEAVRIQHRFR